MSQQAVSNIAMPLLITSPAREKSSRPGLRQVPDQIVGVVDHAGLAEPREPHVGVDPDDGQVAPLGADDEGLDVRNFHAISFAVAGMPGKEAPLRVASASG